MPVSPTPLNSRARQTDPAVSGKDDPGRMHNGTGRPSAQPSPQPSAHSSIVTLATGQPPRLQFVQQYQEDDGALKSEVLAGLLATEAAISPKFFYDVLGSRLFEAITDLPEYYPTRTEAAIFRAFAPAIAARAGRGCVLIDLGAGNCEKAAGLFPTLAPSQYVALDISVEFLRNTLTGLQQQHPQIPMLGLGADLCAELDLPAEVRPGRRLFFYPGSSLGNFAPDQALALLRRLRAAARPGDGVLIGVDLVKDPGRLVAAYDDALGVTAAFNRNVLRNVNRIVGSDFRLEDWCHVASFDAGASRIQMHLQAQCDVTVRWPDGERRFARGDRIHTEDSWKYRCNGMAGMLEAAGFHDPVSWSDEHGWFAVFHARV